MGLQKGTQNESDYLPREGSYDFFWPFEQLNTKARVVNLESRIPHWLGFSCILIVGFESLLMQDKVEVADSELIFKF